MGSTGSPGGGSTGGISSSGRGGSTTYRMTPAGELAYKTHCAALRALLDGPPGVAPAG